jgi:hypothetical protein
MAVTIGGGSSGRGPSGSLQGLWRSIDDLGIHAI